jgi:Haem degrading protein HbpS-like
MFRFLTGAATLALLAGPARADHILPSLALADAQRAIAAALAAQPTVRENVAVVDAGGQLVAFVRQDGAISAGLYGAIGKAVASARFGASSTVLEARMGAGPWTVAPTASAAPLPRPDIAWRGAGERRRGLAAHLRAWCNPDRARRHRRRRGRLRRRD